MGAPQRGQETLSSWSSGGSGAFSAGLNSFREEGRALARLRSHANVVTVFDFFEEHGTAYLVMEFVEGRTAADFARSRGGRLTEREALAIMVPVLDGLRSLHAGNLLHRDLKPANIYICDKGPVKLLDFGAARIASGEASQSLTAILTGGYAPPETYWGRARHGPWTDVYSAGATLYNLLTARIPAPAPARADATVNLASPRDMLCGDVSVRVSDAIMRAMELESERRFQSAREMQVALRQGAGVREPEERGERRDEDSQEQCGEEGGEGLGEGSGEARGEGMKLNSKGVAILFICVALAMALAVACLGSGTLAAGIGGGVGGGLGVAIAKAAGGFGERS